jgi:hypothetical protein
MKKTSEYLRHAKDCRMPAKRTKLEEHREMLVNMAASWEMLAENRSRTEMTKGVRGADDPDAS